MKSNPSGPAADKSAMNLSNRKKTWHSWQEYWFTPRSPLGLHVLRVLTGLVLIFWLVSLAGHQVAFFGLQGWADAQFYKDASKLVVDSPEAVPTPIGWSLLFLARNPSLVSALFWGAILVLVLFTLGVAVRLTAILSWLAVVSFAANPLIHYDADSLLVILAYYMMIAYVLYGLFSQRLSPLGYALGPGQAFLFHPLLRDNKKVEAEPPSHAANMVVRLLQVHFAIIVVTSGLHKLQMGDWWGGIALWFPLHPPFETTFPSIRQVAPRADSYLFMLSLVQYSMLAWQIGFPLFAWRERGWRVVLIGGALLGWLGSAFLYQAPLFGPVYLIFCLAYLTPEEWHWLFTWWRRDKEYVGKAPAVRPYGGAKAASGSVHVKAM